MGKFTMKMIYIVGFVGVIYLGLIALAISIRLMNKLREITFKRKISKVKQFIEKSNNPSVVVTLVHGTWAPKASWTHSSSPLCQALTNATTKTIRFERFTWTGENSITARQRAADVLKLHLWACIKRWPNASHYVIGHSHGGNVALLAMGDYYLAKKINGIACFSTPFLCILRRKLGPLTEHGIAFAPVIISWGLSYLLVWLYSLPFVVLLIGFGVGIFLGYEAEKLIERLEPIILDASRYPEIDPRRVLLIRTVADEASAGISVAYFISRVVGFLSSLLPAPMESGYVLVQKWEAFVERNLAIYGILMGISLLVSASIGVRFYMEDGNGIQWFIKSEPGRFWHYAHVIFAAIIFASGTIATVLLLKGGWGRSLVVPAAMGVLIFPFVPIFFLLGLAVGPELAIAGVLFHVSAEATPPGHWHITQLQTKISNEDGDLLHSQSYLDKHGLSTLQHWFKMKEYERV